MKSILRKVIKSALKSKLKSKISPFFKICGESTKTEEPSIITMLNSMTKRNVKSNQGTFLA